MNGLFEKKNKREFEDIHFGKKTMEYSGFLLYPWKFKTKKPSPLEVLQNYVRSFGKSWPKPRTLWKLHIIVSSSLQGNPLLFFFFNQHLEILWAISSIPLDILSYMQNFQGCKLVFCGIFNGEVTNLDIPGFFFRKVYTEPPFLDFFGEYPNWCEILFNLLVRIFLT